MMIRNKFALKVISLFLVLVVLQPLITPNFASAQVSAPTQIEFTNFEDSGSTDMVNLLTGDFSYKLDLIEVPGPEGSFTAPLFYHAGIGLEQEASWVGLGWNINVGSITRTIAGFPDDANGETQEVTVKDPGVRGWSSSLMGLGHLGLATIGWNSQVGHYGQISLLGLSWAGGDVDLNVKQLGLTVLSVVLIATGVGAPIGAAIAKSAVASAIYTAYAMYNLAKTASVLFNNVMSYQSSPSTPTGGSWDYKKDKSRKIFHTEYKIWLDQTRYEDMFGVLYLSNLRSNIVSTTSPNINVGLKINSLNSTIKQFSDDDYNAVVSDMGYDMPENTDFKNVTSPAVLATDNFNVQASSISGSIMPYRLEVGTVSLPRKMDTGHKRYSILDYLNYKVPFVYENSSSNSYFHHVGGGSSVVAPNFFMNFQTQSSNASPILNTSETLKLDDVIYTNRINPDVTSRKTIATDKHIEWLSNNEIATNSGVFSNSFMDYFSPSERSVFRNLLSSSVFKEYFNDGTNDFSTGVIDIPSSKVSLFSVNETIRVVISWYENNLDDEGRIESRVLQSSSYNLRVIEKRSSSIVVDVSGIRRDEIFSAPVKLKVYANGSSQNKSAIGGFSITNGNGFTYHFSLPILDYQNFTRIEQVSDPNKYSTITRDNPFATTWLLTGITGPDFVDRGGANNMGNGMIDENDWGSWIKFNYARYGTDVKWRAPYGNNEFRVDENNTVKSFVEGYKELYYLNSIETRSHIGLFLKSIRQNDAIYMNGQKSLQLDEFVLLSKENFNRLESSFGLLEHRSKLNTLLYNSLTEAAKQFINLNAERIVKFNYSNNLCKGAPGTHSGNGKLTLESVSVFGKNRVKTTPDYEFTYGFNPNYNKNHWDGWGYYNSEGTSSGLTHSPSSKVIDPTAYSLTKVKTPLGNELNIVYEADNYSSIGGISVNKGVSNIFSDTAPLNETQLNYFDVKAEDVVNFKVGDSIRVKGNYCKQCLTLQLNCLSFDKPTVVSSISNLDARVYTKDPFVSHFNCSPSNGRDFIVNIFVEGGFSNKPGGGLRVKDLFISDNSVVTSKLQYIYKRNELFENNSNSSGVISKEPAFVNNNSQQQPSNIDLPGFPNTPVMYGKVIVKSGLLTSVNDYHTMQVYEFEVPNSNMIIHNKEFIKDNIMFSNKYGGKNDYWKIFHNKITDNTAKIGTLNKVKVYQNSQSGLQLVSETINDYGSLINNVQVQNYQGVYTSGTLMYDVANVDLAWFHKIGKTTIIRNPYVLKSITTINNGIVSKQLNNKFDFYTSRVLDMTVIQPNGLSFRTISKPAYQVAEYSELGSRAFNQNYKNQMGADAAIYTYLVTPYNQTLGLLSAEANTFKKDWNNYRVFNSGTGLFDNQAEGPHIWRVDKSYAWLGNQSKLKADGTFNFSISDEFKFANNASNPGWKLLSENVRVNHSSNLIESKDVKGLSSINIFGHNNKVIIAQVANAQYGEATFSSAEDLDISNGFFGGEVSKGNGIVKSAFNGDLVFAGIFKNPHTGDKLLELNNVNQTGFVFKSNNFKGNKKYKAAVWTNNLEGRLYYKLGSGAAVISSAPIVKMKCGDWYLLEFTFDTPSAPGTVEVGVTVNSNQVVWFDDFKVQPYESAMTCNVYPSPDVYFSNTNNLEMYNYVLSNDHLYTKSVYSANNKVEKVFVESFKHGGEKLVSESKEYFRRNQ